MSTERDAGIQALQQGNPAAAAPLLEAACQQNPADFDALLFLGAAYGQIGRQMDAINTITRAVQVQPANAQARYNLAVAMEQGGYVDQAITALGQALTLQPEYPKAQDALRRLQGGSASGVASSPSAPSPVAAAPSASEPSYGQSGAGIGSGSGGSYRPAETPAPQTAESGSSSGPPAFGSGQAGDSGASASLQPSSGEQPSYSPAEGSASAGYSAQPISGGAGYGAPPSSGDGYGAQPAASTPGYNAPAVNTGYSAQPTAGQGQPIYGAPPTQPAGGAYAQPGANPQYGAQSPQPAPYGAPTPSPYASPTPAPYGSLATGQYGQTSPYSETPRRSGMNDDSFDIVQAAKNWIAVLTKPKQFFDEMTGTVGMLAPLALALLYVIPGILGTFIAISHSSAAFKQLPGFGPLIASGGIFLFLLIGLPITIGFVFLAAWVIHLVGLLFGNRSPYSASFRALVFAYAPLPITGLLASFFPLGPALEANPISRLLSFVGFIWFVVLLVMAISSEQEISIGPAVGVVVISAIVSFILLIGVGIALGIVIGILFAAAAAGSHGMIPFQ